VLQQRLRDLDNRVLRVDQRAAQLRTEAGWRRFAARWTWWAGFAAVLLGAAQLGVLFAPNLFTGLISFGGMLAFQAGRLKAEDDRLNGRGKFNSLRPPGL